MEKENKTAHTGALLMARVTEFLEFLEVQKGASENTIDAYSTDLRQWCHFVEKEMIEWENSDQKDLFGFIIWLQEQTGISRRTQARKISAVKALYQYLERTDQIEKNLIRKTRAPRYKRGLPKPIRPIELEELLEGETEQKKKIQVRDQALMELLYSSGMRISEALSLRVSDLCDESGGVHSECRVIGKGKKERIVFIGSRAKEVLKQYIAVYRSKLHNEGPLFLNYNGRPLTRQGAVYILKQRRISRNIDQNVTPHSFRHSFATDMLNEGADIRMVQEMLGHTSVSTTQNYTRVALDRLKNTFWTAHPHAKKRD